MKKTKLLITYFIFSLCLAISPTMATIYQLPGTGVVWESRFLSGSLQPA